MTWQAIALLWLAGASAFAQSNARLPSTVVPDRYTLTLTPDLKAARFSGEETIEVRLARPTREVTLHAVELEIAGARATSAGATQPAEVSFDAARQTLTLRFAAPLAAGPATLALEWKGAFNRKLAGLFLIEQHGRRYAFTQFEPTDARRVFPCFDEPAEKARFLLTAVIDADLNAVSNGAIESEHSDGKKKTVHFAETAPMSSYLVALGVGPLAELRGRSGKTPLRVIAARDQIELGRYALDVAERLLPRYEEYFGIPYPFGKLDLVALPDSFEGAMENTGAIFFRDLYLLVDPAAASASQKQNVALTVAHEMAHQWFGDLVTMRWWDDLWLNEAFATWAELRFGDQIWPQWDLWTESHNWLGLALALDQLSSTHAIRTPVTSPAEANEAFDVITYSKGAAVLRMMESWLGEEPFRRGIARYLKAHQYGNTSAEDLWSALEAETNEPVAELARAWTEQPGVPLVTVVNARCAGGVTKLDVEQQRFFVSHDESAHGAALQQKWPIPLCLRIAGGKPARCELVREARAHLTLDGCGPLLANAGENGYYRVRYDAATLAALTAAHDRLTAAERIGLLRDQWALVRQGSVSLARFLDLVTALRGERAPAAVMELVSALRFLDDYLITDERDRARLRALLAGLFSPLFAELGWDPKPGESDATHILRAQLLDVLGRNARLPSVLKEAEARLQRYLAKPSSLDGSVADEVVQLAALRGNAARWEDFRERARTAKTPELAMRFRDALPEFEDPALIARTLDLTLLDEVPPEDALGLIWRELGNSHGRAAAWAFVRKNFAALRKKSSDIYFSRLIVDSGRLCEPGSAEEVARFFADPAHHVEATEKRVEQAVTSIRLCNDLRQRESANLSFWLRAHDR